MFRKGSSIIPDVNYTRDANLPAPAPAPAVPVMLKLYLQTLIR